ncbi:hypothetical protein UC34_17800 [Pandoraea vervacti]|uniref:Uncharacterized protein n=1 Tax=Pandoraea vervacti TaxID=656178 RepID=A0ABN4FSW4_9BURK|nr:hypothetical protein [Pandoraea vervacti]AJP58314.1 hypothetical protein UC34_17800 [Pandoraea vervacti]
MHVPSQPLPGYWPQLSNWQVRAGEVSAGQNAAATFTSIRNRLPEGHTIRMASMNTQAEVAEVAEVMASGRECRSVHVDDFTHNVLTALVTPQDGCASRRYTRNADLRTSVAIALALHPDDGDALLEARLKALGLPSLLRDEPQYRPGTLEALRYDVGSRIVAIGRSKLPDLANLGAPDDLALHAAGERELSYLNGESPHAAQVALDHKRILDFHYGAAGVTTWEKQDREFHDGDVKHVKRASDNSRGAHEGPEPRIGTFIEHLARCQQRVEPTRTPTRAKGRIPIPQNVDAQRSRRKTKVEPPPYPLSPQHDILYNCTLL